MKLFIKHIALFFLVILAFSGCQKSAVDELANYEDQYSFYFQGILNGESINLSAGADGYTLNTYYQFSDGIVSLIGKIEKDNASGRSFELIIRSKDSLDAPFNFNVENNIVEGNYPYRDPNAYTEIENTYDFTFSPKEISTSNTYNWTFADGSNTSVVSPSLRVSSIETSKFWASLQHTDITNSCSGIAEHQIAYEADPCKAYIDLSASSGSTLNATLAQYNQPISTVVWYVNHEKTEEGISLSNYDVSALYGIIKIEAIITFANQCVHTTSKTFTVNSNIELCESDFDYTIAPAKWYNPSQRGTVELIYQDENGKRYSSFYADNNGAFVLSSIRPYETNEKNQPTVRFLFHGNITLKSDNGEALEMQDSFGSFAVAYPSN